MKPSKGTIRFVYEDEQRQTEFHLAVNYTVYPPVPQTWVEPGEPAMVEWDWCLQEVWDWSFDSKQAVVAKFGQPEIDADKIVRRWLQGILDTPEVRTRIEEACFEDANDSCEAARERHEDERFERARLGRVTDFVSGAT